MNKVFDLVRQSTATVGAGTITLGSAAAGFRTFAQGLAVTGDICTFAIADANGTTGLEWGVYNSTGPTLTRGGTYPSGTAAVSLSGSAQIISTLAVEDFASTVIGPASVTDDLPAIFDGTTGKLIKQKTYAAFKTLLALVKADVGLGSVDNTSDAGKPVSAAQQTALNLKADYQEGTWTPADFSNGLTLTVTDARYVRVGKLCTVSFAITYPSTADGTVNLIGGLPFTSYAGTNAVGGGALSYTNCANELKILVSANAATFQFYGNAGIAPTNAALSTFIFRATFTYQIA